MKIRKEWQPSEEKFLAENYATMDFEEICQHLNRKAPAVYDKAFRLGLRRGQKTRKATPKRSGFPWNKKETTNLIKWYAVVSAKRIAEKTHRTEDEVHQMAINLGLRYEQ